MATAAPAHAAHATAIPKLPKSLDDHAQPHENMSNQELLTYAQRHYGLAEFFARKTAGQVWLVGRALTIVKKRLKPKKGEWLAWVDRAGISRTSAWAAVRIAETFPTLESAEEFTLNEAKTLAGIVKEATAKESATATASGKSEDTPGNPARVRSRSPESRSPDAEPDETDEPDKTHSGSTSDLDRVCEAIHKIRETFESAPRRTRLRLDKAKIKQAIDDLTEMLSLS